jgi:hypothetical protein
MHKDRAVYFYHASVKKAVAGNFGAVYAAVLIE